MSNYLNDPTLVDAFKNCRDRSSKQSIEILELKREIKKLADQFQAFSFVGTKAMELVNYFKKNSNTIEEFDSCLDVLEEYDDYINKYIIEPNRSNNTKENNSNLNK